MDYSVTAVIALGTLLVSFFNAAIGPTGGMQLALVAYLLPPQLSIPTHGVITGVSSLARAVQLRRYIDWNLFWRFAPASVIGTLVASVIFIRIHEGILLSLIGCAIFVNNFVPYRRLVGRRAAPLLDGMIGLVTGLLTVFVGATGPVIFTYIAASDKGRREVMGTAAACTTLQHLAKVLAFSFIVTTVLLEYAGDLAIFGCAAILGTRLGADALTALSEQTFRIGFKTATSLIALYLIFTGVTGYLAR